MAAAVRARKSRLVSLRNVGALPSAHVLSIRRALVHHPFHPFRPTVSPVPDPLVPSTSSPSRHPFDDRPHADRPILTRANPGPTGSPGNRPLPHHRHRYTATFGFLDQEKNVSLPFFHLPPLLMAKHDHGRLFPALPRTPRPPTDYNLDRIYHGTGHDRYCEKKK